MPAAVVPIHARREGIYVLLDAALPGSSPQTIGVILVDPATDRGWVRFRDRYDDIAEPDDAEVFAALQDDIAARLAESGAGAFLSYLEDSLSNVLRVSERQIVAVDAFTRVLDRIYSESVEPLPAQPFRTHLPLYSLRAAAGSLGDEMPSEAEDWVRVPEGIRLTPDLFVAHVTGRSMEPRIPDGSLNLFRLHPVGSRQNKILLIQRFGSVDDTARYTIKRYHSEKVRHEDGTWEHDRIRLEPLNAEFEPWDVEPQDFAVVAEWLRVIE